MVLTHQEAIRLSSEARDSGDREEARKYSKIARDLQGRATSGETRIDYYDTQTGRISHSTAGSDIYVAQMSGESDRFVPISKQQVSEIRQFTREQPSLIVPRQTVSRGDEVLYTQEPGSEPGTLLRTFPGEPPKWTVSYDAGSGEQKKEFESEQEAESFRSSLTTRLTEKFGTLREAFFTDTQAGAGDFLAYLKSIGPPIPTEAQKARSEAGIPQIGIPGPALTKPGSPMEKAQDFMDKVLEKTEIPFKAITDPIRSIEAILSKASLDVLKTSVAFQPPVLLGSQTQPIYDVSGSFRVPKAKQPAVGVGIYLGGIAAGVLASGIDVATFEVRPGLIKETTGSAIGLVVNSKTREALVETVATDPFKFVANIVGGAAVGYKLRGGDIQGAIRESESKVRKFLAKREFDRLGIDENIFTQFERELFFDFPEETVESTTKTTLFKRGELKILNDVDLITKKIPYFIETEAQTENLLKQLSRVEPDPWGPTQITKEVESYFALPFDEGGGAILVKGKAGMKPFAEPSAPLPPRAEQLAVSVAKTKPPVLKALPKTKFFSTSMIEESVFHYPAVDLRATLLTAPTAMIPNIFPPTLKISSLLSVKGVSSSLQRLDQVSKELLKTPQSMKQFLVTTPFSVQAPRFIQDQKPISIQTQIPKPIQITVPFQIPIPIQTVIQTPIPKQDQIQIPIPSPPPTIIVPRMPPPPQPPPKIIIKAKRKKKKKKKKTKGVKGAYELRVDKIVKDLLKDLKA